MSTNLKIWIALAVTVVAVFAAVWQIANVRGMRARGRRRAPAPEPRPGAAQRHGDTRNFTAQERKLLAESQNLLGQGKVAAASRILEQLGMQREAIQVFEDHGMIHDAAKILMRMQRHNRAGVVYARHGLWEHAAQCFKLANMPLEVAKCAREAGDMAQAAEYFEKVGRFEDAGECYERLGDFHRAARLFSNVGQRQKAMAMYNRLAAAAENLAAVEFEEQELQGIVDYLASGHTDEGLAAVAVSRNKLTEVILGLVAKGMTKPAAELYLRATADIGPMLMAEVSYQNKSAGCLAEVFLQVGAFPYAGMIFERMNAFDRAGEAFERAEDFERASYCFERSGMDARSRAAKERARTSSGRSVASSRSSFALANVTTSDSTPSALIPPASIPLASVPKGFDGDGEATAVVDLANLRPANAMPRPPSPVTTPEPAEAAPPPAAKVAIAPPPPPTEHGDVNLEDGRAAFHKAKFFADLDFEQKNKLWALGQTLAYRAEATILTYNDEPRGVYVITRGSVSCYKQVGGKETYVDQMGEAESFGELWLLADQPTAVRFVASKDSQIRVIPREPFTDLMDKDGTIARKLYKRFTMRLLKRLLRPQNSRSNQAAS